MNSSGICPRLSADSFLSEKECVAVTARVIDGYPLHWHDFFELEIVTKGNGIHLLNGKKHLISPGSAYLLKPTDFHEIIAGEEIELYNITFKDRSLSESTLLSLSHSEGQKRITLEGRQYESALLAARLLKNERDTGGIYQQQFLEYLLHFFMKASPSALNPEQLSGINKALIYLEFHFREKLTLSVLAKEAGFHPSYFSELFKEATGETFTEKLNHLRLEYACTLLANNCAVSYACFESGFGSLSNFFTAFKREYGISPREYARHPEKGK